VAARVDEGPYRQQNRLELQDRRVHHADRVDHHSIDPVWQVSAETVISAAIRPLDDRQAHPERHFEREEHRSDAVARPAFHRGTSMAQSESISKPPAHGA
jgi:hypothetical protein